MNRLVLVWKSYEDFFSIAHMKRLSLNTPRIWKIEEEKKSWLITVPTISSTNLNLILKSFESYHKYGLNVDGISEALMNIAIRNNLGSELSIARKKIPKIRKALYKAYILAKSFQGSLTTNLASSIKENLMDIDEIEDQYDFYEKELIRKGIKTKRPSLEAVHSFEGELISYFYETAYCKSISEAQREVLRLIKYIGHLISLRQLGDIYQKVKKLPNFFGSEQVHNCPSRFNTQN